MRLLSCLLHVSLITSIRCARNLKRSSTRYPNCSPEISEEPEDTVDINYVFIMDHFFPDENIGKLKYLLKAMSCEITSTAPYKLNIWHLNGKQNIISKSASSANFTDLMDIVVSKDSKNLKTKSLCQRLEAPLQNMKINSSSFYRLIVPFDTAIENCSLVDTFRSAFEKHEDKYQIHLDIIKIGKSGTFTIPPIISLEWSSIDVKVEKLTKANVFQTLSKYGQLAEELTEWVHNTLNKTGENKVFGKKIEETLSPTNGFTPSTESANTTVTLSEKLTSTSVNTVKSTASISPTTTTTKPKHPRIPEKPLLFNVVEERRITKKAPSKLEHNNEVYDLRETGKGSYEIINSNFTLHENDKLFMDGKTYLVHDFTLNNTEVQISLRAKTNETLKLQLDVKQFVSQESMDRVSDLLQTILMLYLPATRGNKMLVAGMENEPLPDDALRLGWKESLIVLIFLLILLLLICCVCRYRRNKKTEYYITNPALSPLVSTQSSHEEKTSSASKISQNHEKTNPTGAAPIVDRTQPSQYSSASTQLGSQSQSNPEPYSPPLHFVADLRYDSLRVTPPASAEPSASERAPLKKAEELKSLRIGN